MIDRLYYFYALRFNVHGTIVDKIMLDVLKSLLETYYNSYGFRIKDYYSLDDSYFNSY
jgi:hypothetical protein